MLEIYQEEIIWEGVNEPNKTRDNAIRMLGNGGVFQRERAREGMEESGENLEAEVGKRNVTKCLQSKLSRVGGEDGADDSVQRARLPRWVETDSQLHFS